MVSSPRLATLKMRQRGSDRSEYSHDNQRNEMLYALKQADKFLLAIVLIGESAMQSMARTMCVVPSMLNLAGAFRP